MINLIVITGNFHIGLHWNPITVLIGLFVALMLAGLIMWIKRSSLKSVHFQRAACDYTRQGSFKLTQKRDDFLFANTTRVPRQQNNSSTGGTRRRS